MLHGKGHSSRDSYSTENISFSLQESKLLFLKRSGVICSAQRCTCPPRACLNCLAWLAQAELFRTPRSQPDILLFSPQEHHRSTTSTWLLIMKTNATCSRFQWSEPRSTLSIITNNSIIATENQCHALAQISAKSGDEIQFQPCESRWFMMCRM